MNFPLILHYHETYQADAPTTTFSAEDKEFSTIYAYKVVDGIFTEPKYAIAVASGDGCSDFIDIDARTQLILASTLLSKIKEIHKNGKRCLIVFIVSDFPYIHMRLDTRDQSCDDSDNFFKDVHNLWSVYDITKSVPIIITNTKLPHTSLSLIDNLYKCLLCGNDAKMKCSICGYARYCSKECQTTDWGIHKKYHL